MKSTVENILVGLVGILLLAIVALIVKYNMQHDTPQEEIVYEKTVVEPASKKEKTSAYLKNMEGYADVDVKVDPEKEDHSNVVEVKAETGEDDLAVVVEDKSKSSYMKNLENYSKEQKESTNSKNTSSESDEDEPVKPEHEEIVDEVGMAIDAALSD